MAITPGDKRKDDQLTSQPKKRQKREDIRSYMANIAPAKVATVRPEQAGGGKSSPEMTEKGLFNNQSGAGEPEKPRHEQGGGGEISPEMTKKHSLTTSPGQGNQRSKDLSRLEVW